MDKTCTVDTCNRPRYQKRIYCSTHAMNLHRYGSPTAGPPPRTYQDLTGRRVGSLVVLERVAGGRWRCQCDCGNTKVIRTGDLNRGAITTCGERPTHPRKQVVSYAGAHDRIEAVSGRARDHDCVDCGEPAAHWSYDHADPDELHQLVPVKRRWEYLVAYSLRPEHYQARCVPCHRRFDLDRPDAHAVA